MIKGTTKIIVFSLILLSSSFLVFSQEKDSTAVTGHLGGAVALTNTGISTIPNLTLGKPAAIFDLSIGKGKLSFEPQFRFALEGKPWSFIFWWRYRVFNTGKFQLGVGAHPAFAFKTTTVPDGEFTKEIITVQRYIASEVVPTFNISKNINAGFYYLYSYCMESGGLKNTNYLAGRLNFSNIKLSDKMYLRFMPQLYYLKMDKNSGYYFNSSVSLVRRNFPVTISSLINKTIKTDIPVGKDFLWNVSIAWSFNKEYVKK
jgi:hypothetical protein